MKRLGITITDKKSIKIRYKEFKKKISGSWCLNY